ncbi:YezD family protein [Pyrinomonas methylaliphatogenes]|jgi:hypothetical protein|uniref:Uncharacterized small protein n=1 Tax=Pyrinomonas methylaliphatogenes TaxID=454194 RepID=A0A0B6WWW6_9BACT|nr:YezD family protein [Pyrinomonas methylaliphatogenes]CDM64625.1 uncharacterized small protein [Pyrinomonas methylaliphatogenes]
MGERAPQRLNQTAELPEEIEREILTAIRTIRYGSVEIIIHDSRVVQIERKEKVRFEPSASKGGAAHTTC